MSNIYKDCPVLKNAEYTLRLIDSADTDELLSVYSDEKAVPFFNGDNCDGDDFHYSTIERMRQAVDFWLFSYEHEYFVRFSIIDNAGGHVIGTIELFNRRSEDAYNNCGLMRLDLRNDYETCARIAPILELVRENMFELFDCDIIATKAIPLARERIAALRGAGYSPSSAPLCGNDGTQYSGYWTMHRQRL